MAVYLNSCITVWKRIGPLALLLVTQTGSLTLARQQGISGTIRSKSGEPLAGVRVSCSRDRETETDDKGRFFLPNRGDVIFLQRNGYRPVVLMSNKLTDRIDLAMEESEPTEVQVPSCEKSFSGRRFTFGPFGLVIPKHARLRRGRDIDYTSFSISHASGNHEFFFGGISGPVATRGFPSDTWISSSSEISSRSWQHGDADWVDIHGRTQDGGLWRYVGSYGFSISYEKASREAAAFFDAIIDSACLRY
jgi:hypothetical protein